MQLLLLYHKTGEEENIPQGLAGNMKKGLRKLGVEERVRHRPTQPAPSSSARACRDTRLFFAQDGENLFHPWVSAWAEQTVPGKEEPSQPLCSTDAMAVTSRLCAASSAGPSSPR